MLSLFLVLFLISLTDAGCYQKSLCCTGRNNSCMGKEDGISHLPLAKPSPKRNYGDELSKLNSEKPLGETHSYPFLKYPTPYYENAGDGYDLIYPSVYEDKNHEKIGRLVLPDIIELEGLPGSSIYDQYGLQDDTDDLGPANLIDFPSGTQDSTMKRVEHLYFGYPEGPEDLPTDELRFSNKPKHLLIRFSVLSQHLPLTTSTSLEPIEWDETRLMYLESGNPTCFCDEECIKLGDCCSDYTFVCLPPRDCIVSDWGPWEGCRPDQGICGSGVEQRVRQVRQQVERGGTECPPLKEMRACCKTCPILRTHHHDMTTVALLLDYKYNKTREASRKDSAYFRKPEMAEKLKNAMYYCVEYKLGWVNRNCWNEEIIKKLHRGNTICGECQPEAQLHRKNGRCASDLDDGEIGFWKLIGPKSCNGMWTRVARTDNCRCSHNMTQFDPFLLV